MTLGVQKNNKFYQAKLTVAWSKRNNFPMGLCDGAYTGASTILPSFCNNTCDLCKAGVKSQRPLGQSNSVRWAKQCGPSAHWSKDKPHQRQVGHEVLKNALFTIISFICFFFQFSFFYYYSWFPSLCQFLLYGSVILHTYVYPFPFLYYLPSWAISSGCM